MLNLQAINRVFDRRKSQYHQGQNAFASDIKEIIQEAVPYRIHAVGSVLPEIQKAGKEGAAEPAENCNEISDVKSASRLREEARKTQTAEGEDIVQKYLQREKNYRVDD